MMKITRTLHKWDPEKMALAVEAVRCGEISIRSAAKEFCVPRSSLQDRLKGRVSNVTKLGRKPHLPEKVEREIVDVAFSRAKQGVGLTKTMFLRYAGNVAKEKNMPFLKSTPSDKWWQLMKRRHTNIVRRKPEATASIRHERMDRELVKMYFTALESELRRNGLMGKPDCIWNMDETGMTFNHTPKNVVAPKGIKYLHSRVSGKRELITCIATVNAAGKALPPHFVVKGKTRNALLAFDVENLREGANMSVSDSGWTKEGIAKLWFEQSFLPNIGKQRPQILILDGHDSHCFVELIEIAIKEQIIIIELPAHTSNWLQPLDVSVFHPLKSAYSDECQKFMNERPTNIISKTFFCKLFQTAWDMAMTEKNITSGFRACGIHPLNPDEVKDSAYHPNEFHQQDQLTSTQYGTDNAAVSPTSKGVEPASPTGTSEPIRLNLELINRQLMRDDNLSEESVGYISNEEGDNTASLTQPCPPEMALTAFTSTINPSSLSQYKKWFAKGIEKPSNRIYSTWRRLKEAAKLEVENNGINQDVLYPKLCSQRSTNGRTLRALQPKKTFHAQALLTATDTGTTDTLCKQEITDHQPSPLAQRTTKPANSIYFVLTSKEVYEAKLEKKRKKAAAESEREAKKKKREETKAKREKALLEKKKKENRKLKK